jgi:hypothetical protein
VNDIFAAYNLDIDDLGEFYRKLNEKITFADGMVTSLGIIYWGRDDYIPALSGAIPQIKAEGIHRFSELQDALRTPGRLKKFAQQTGLSPQILRILQHDLDLWAAQSRAPGCPGTLSGAWIFGKIRRYRYQPSITTDFVWPDTT